MIMETTLNGQWERRAYQTRERPEREPLSSREPKTKRADSAVRAPQPGSALAVAGLTPDEVKRLAAKFSNAPVKPGDKAGVPAASAAGVVSVWIEVTVDMAARWLKVNFVNRPVSAAVVAAYARDMVACRWQPTHQGLAFNDRDELIDGQHRLLAVLKCGRAVRMMVTFGLPSKIPGSEMTTMDCVDRGRTRSVADQLKIQHGLKQGAQIAAVTAALAHLCVGEKMRRLSVGQTLDVYRAFEPGVNFVLETKPPKGMNNAAVLAAFAFIYQIKGSDARGRFACVMTGQGLDQHPALQLLREFLLDNQALVLMRNLHRGIVELVTHALWLDLTATPVAALEQRPEEWLQAVAYFRAQQPERVAKIAALFKTTA